MNNLWESAKKIHSIRDFVGTIEDNKAIAPLCSFKIGGKAALFVEPASVKELIEVIKILKSYNEDFFILGGGTNLLVSDEGFDCAVISTARFNQLSIKNQDTLVCQAALHWNTICEFCAENCISGLEEFCGLPGTAGGAVYMNARCFEKQVSDLIKKVEYLDCNDLCVKEYLFDSKDWDYKKSPFSENAACSTEKYSKKIILSVEFSVNSLEKTSSNKEKIKSEGRKFLLERVNKGHFKFPSAGSVFKNNRDFGAPSGVLIDKAGLKGLQHGGAQIAPWHGNFIINTGGASAKDVAFLVRKAQEIVLEKYGFNLEPEIIFCGKSF